jgi:hypothetical protein
MKDCFTTGSPRLSQCCVSPPSAEIAEGSEKETRPAGRRRTRECRVLCVNRTEETGGEARPRNTRTHAHTRWMAPGSGAGCKGTLKIRMDEDQILAHGAVRRNCATGPLKLDCHSGIDQQSDDRDGGPHERGSSARKPSPGEVRCRIWRNGTETKAHGKATRQITEEVKGP